MLTGESVPVEVSVGDTVTGATLNAGGRLVVEATRVGSDTQLARMAKLVEDAQNGKAAAQRLADRISAVFVPVPRWTPPCSPASPYRSRSPSATPSRAPP
ncbi:hypothetical protein EAO71_21505 [Streptomyces sp. ms191]|uniref:P-type ATPase n=1 Tax=Streptomyces sp. ms191 TaxID=1827978 RepID=UPI0011CE0B7B|nr:hypothetical protein [Streptomyces sp. ms191]TXS26194.1 hypothetical protein EAO71_21505 [Streptomyces sp. ms191]